VSGLANARMLMERILSGEKFDFIEVMACPGGCIAGGGQPYADESVKALRRDALNVIDKNLSVRLSHKNTEVLDLYREHLEKPLSEKSHHLLHTHYYKRGKFGN
jgi:iron only hydrogenase large subunit-like protein